jgi:DNA-binding response OmpR family regulator
MLLADRTVLLVDPDTSALDSLSVELRTHGAKCFAAKDAETALWGARETLPDVVISELELPDRDASTLLFELRTGAEAPPAIALAKNRRHLAKAREHAHGFGRGFDKRLAKPARASDVVDAICCVIGARAEHRGAPSVEVIESALERHDYRRLLGALNATTEHRFSALFRFDETMLTSVWTFDRTQPKTDSFPLDVPIAATPLFPLCTGGEAACVPDTGKDERFTREQRHADMRSFAAVPLHAADDRVFGALCHFDPDSRATDSTSFDLLERAAKIFRFRKRRARPK